LKEQRQTIAVAGVVALVIGIAMASFALYCVRNLGREVAHAREEVQILLSKLRTEEDGLLDEAGTDSHVRFPTLSEAEGLVQKLGVNPSAEQLAEAILTIDGWLIKPGEGEAFKKYKLDQQSRLRQLVKAEVWAHQDEAINAATSAEGMKQHAEAGRILAFYPMSDDPSVVGEAKLLAARQTEVVVRLEALRRQRYNRWATEQIEKAIDFFNANVSHFNPFNDNAVLIDSLVKNLGEADPVWLEPAVLELYNYVIDRTKGSITEQNKMELAKRLTDPSVRRKVLGDF
jgi:hypothetical protein